MCMRATSVRPYQCWNWAGDEIVPDPIIPAERRIPGSRKRHYDIDARQFLGGAGNAVLRGAIAELVLSLPVADQARFRSRAPGSFDFRRDCVLQFLGRFHYQQLRERRSLAARRAIKRKDHFEPWLFPDETLALGHGDCEDLAFLLASLLEASGISSYCLRVAFGRIVDHGAAREWDHTWVVYLDERGVWEILEPLARFGAATNNRHRRAVVRAVRGADDVEYVPFYVLNRDHLWRVRSRFAAANAELHDYLRDRKFWRGFDPSFAIKTHDHILDGALAAMSDQDRKIVKRAGFWLDVNVLEYDPRDHFDFAYVEEGWALAARRLASASLEDLGRAAHSIADFYAHTVYAEFAPRRADGSIRPYWPGFDASAIQYDFAPYDVPGCKSSRAEASRLYAGRLISGQWWRWYSTFPDELQDADGFWQRRCLPDHDQLAVDEPRPRSDGYHRYRDCWDDQFQVRRAAAVEHVRQAYGRWSKKHA
ncbi:MAG: transglutaminase-like domain-containing protein [Planctomycetota bacterium]